MDDSWSSQRDTFVDSVLSKCQSDKLQILNLDAIEFPSGIEIVKSYDEYDPNTRGKQSEHKFPIHVFKNNKYKGVGDNIKKIFFTGHSEMEEIPSEFISMFPNVKDLWLQDNALKSLPEEIGQLIKLKELLLQRNKLGSVPESFCQLKHLKELRLDSNSLTDLPEAMFSSMQHLAILHLEQNCLLSLPPSLASASSLTELYIDQNLLTEIPKWFSSLSELQTLSMDNNKIKEIPLDIMSLAKLEVLSLESNRITFAPPELSGMAKLSHIRLFNNPILNLPEKLTGKDSLSALVKSQSSKADKKNSDYSQKIFEYLKEFKDIKEPCYRAKLMMVGQENVGKTSLLNCIRQRHSSSKNLSTDGIDIHNFTTKTVAPSKDNDNNNGKPLKVEIEWSAWDFAGQEVYYASHQMFLSSRSVYLLLWNLSQPLKESRFEYWLNAIKAKSPKAPVIIVGTHLDDCGKSETELDDIRQQIADKFGRFENIRSIVEVDARKGGKKVEELVRLLNIVAFELPGVGDPIPKAWSLLEEGVFKERKELAKQKKQPILSWSEYSVMANMCGVPSAALPRATKFFSEIGTLCHFDDVKAGMNDAMQSHRTGLKDIVIIDPTFIIDLIATVVSTKLNFIKNGTLTYRHLVLLWKQYPESLHSVLIHLLEKFEICIQLHVHLNLSSIITYTSRHFSKANLRTSFSKSMDRPKQAASTNLNDVVLLFPWYLNNVPLDPEVVNKYHQASIINIQFPHKFTALERKYQFEFVPHGLFSRLIVRMMVLKNNQQGWKMDYTRNEILVSVGNEAIKDAATKQVSYVASTAYGFIRLSEVSRQISIFVGGGSPLRLLRVIVENLESLLEDWFPNLTFKVFVTCAHCLKNYISQCESNAAAFFDFLSSNDAHAFENPLLHSFNLDSIQQQISTAQEAVSCPLEEVLDISPLMNISIENYRTLTPQISSENMKTLLKASSSEELPKKTTRKQLMKKTSKAILGSTSTESIGSSSSTSSMQGSGYHLSTLFEESLSSLQTSKSFFRQPSSEVLLHDMVPDICLSFVERIPFGDLQIEKQIGEGSFATVLVATYKNQKVAVKKYLMQAMQMEDWQKELEGIRESPYDEFRRETALMSELHHPNIVSLIGICTDPLCMVTEFMNCGDLQGWLLKKESDLEELLRVKIALDISRGCQYLHHLVPPIIHRDLKSPNVLLTRNDDGTYVAKLGDLGLSRRIPTQMIQRKVDNPRWLAPEIIDNKPYNEKADTFSFAIILWELIERRFPYDEYDCPFTAQLEAMIVEGARPTIRESERTTRYGVLMKSAWHSDPAERPAFDTITEELEEIYKSLGGVIPSSNNNNNQLSPSLSISSSKYK